MSNVVIEEHFRKLKSIPTGGNMTVSEGKKAPDFTLTNKDGVAHTLSKIESGHIVLYFYPKDDTPGCTLEAKDFSDILDEFRKADTLVIGVSGGDDKSKAKFCAKHNLKILLLSDPEFETSKKYGLYGKKTFMGKEYMGISRTTYVLDAKKNVLRIFENVTPKGHAQEVLEFIEQL